MTNKLRVGLLLDSFDIPAWTYVMLEKIRNSDYAEIVLVVLNTSNEQPQNLFSKLKENCHILLYLIYCRIENIVFKPSPNAFENRNAAELLGNIRTLKVSPRQTQYSDWIRDDDVEAIKQNDIDVFIRLGFRILRGKILTSTKLGIWSYHHGDNTIARGVPAGFWEVFKNYFVTGSTLQILTEELDNGLVLYKSYSATDYLSVNRSRNHCYWKGTSFIPRKLEELYRIGREKFTQEIKERNQHFTSYSNKCYQLPKNGEFLKLLFKHFAKCAGIKLYDLFFFNQWILLFDLRAEISTTFWRFKKIVPPKDRFWADPHVIHKDSQYYVFIEEFPYHANKGHISLLIMDRTGNYTKPVKILEQPYHLSNPFVFEWQGDHYMIPESSSNRTIEVYKCVSFPYQWKFYKKLMQDITAVDPILYYDQQKWWLFTNISENAGASTLDELFLFYSDSPISDHWTPHPQNPIVSDVRKARPAGRIFTHNNNIYRPAQICSRAYGYGVKINQILKLSEREYQEQEMVSIKPNWDKDIKGIHAFDHKSGLTIIDGKLKRARFPFWDSRGTKRLD